MTLIHDLLTDIAARRPSAPAIIEAPCSIDYVTLDRTSNAVAHLLQRRGICAGDRVLVALRNSWTWVATYFGILKAGAVAVPLAADGKNRRIAFALRDCAPRAAFMEPAAASHFTSVLRDGAVQLFTWDRSSGAIREGGTGSLISAPLEELPSTGPDVPRIDLDLAAIIYTSGSTGEPRGVRLSHLNIRSNTQSIVEYLGLSAADRVMVVLPFHYVYGLSLLQTHVAVGGALVLDGRFAFPNVILKTMQECGVTGFAGVPSTFAMLLHRSSIRRMSFPALRYATQAGGAMPPALILEWRQAIPSVPLFVMYGATEASARLTYLDPVLLDRKLGSIGRPIPNVEVRVLTKDGREAPPGEVGELVARGANISSGYWNAPDDTARAFTAHGYWTGDLGYCDEEGFLYLVGRKGDMLKVGGHRVAAREIEEVLYEHPGVHEAAVLGVAHDLLGEAPIAFVAPRDARAITPADVIDHCRTRLPDHKVPVRVEICVSIPKNGSGKIDKLALREQIA